MITKIIIILLSWQTILQSIIGKSSPKLPLSPTSYHYSKANLHDSRISVTKILKRVLSHENIEHSPGSYFDHMDHWSSHPGLISFTIKIYKRNLSIRKSWLFFTLFFQEILSALHNHHCDKKELSLNSPRPTKIGFIPRFAFTPSRTGVLVSPVFQTYAMMTKKLILVS